MKSIFLICFFLEFGFSQSTWKPVPNLLSNPTGIRYEDVFFLNESLGWVANGPYGTVHKTTDGGQTWTEQLNETVLGANYYFRNIEFLNANTGFLGTLNGDFFKSLDSGNTWSLVTNISNNPPAICGIAAANSSVVYTCGAYFGPAYIIKSIDGGNTWQYFDMSTYANALVEVLFENQNIGYAAGRSDSGAIVLKTINGGMTWTEIYNSNTQGEYIWKLQFVGNDTNVIYGSLYTADPNPGKLIKSFNAGTTWTSLNAPEPRIQAVGFISQNKGWMGGKNTGFFETNNGGMTWTDLKVGSNLNRIFVLSETRAFAAGTSIYKFTDEPLGIENFEGYKEIVLDINLISNPVETVLEIEVEFKKSDHLLIELYDSKGLFLKQLKYNNIQTPGKINYEFDVSNLTSGIYILDFHSNTGREAKKFIKK